MTRSDRRWCWIFSGLILLLTAVPYVLAFLQAGSEWVFSGFVFGVEDGNSYIAKMLAGSAGAWLFRTPYTGMQQNGTLAFLPYLLLGKLAQPPALHTKLILLFQLFRLCGIPVLIFSIFRFVSLFLDSTANRRWATGLAVVGGGLGWLIPLLGQTTWLGSLPLDFYSPETFGFLSILGLPSSYFCACAFPGGSPAISAGGGEIWPWLSGRCAAPGGGTSATHDRHARLRCHRSPPACSGGACRLPPIMENVAAMGASRPGNCIAASAPPGAVIHLLPARSFLECMDTPE